MNAKQLIFHWLGMMITSKKGKIVVGVKYSSYRYSAELVIAFPKVHKHVAMVIGMNNKIVLGL